MNKDFLKVVLFIFGGLFAFIYVGFLVNRASGGGVAKASITGVSPEAGESIFWGKGKCWTCHSVGGKGSASRCPNQGAASPAYTLGLAVGARAAERAKERSGEIPSKGKAANIGSSTNPLTGQPWNAVEYIFECITDPDAYVVETFSPGVMPIVYKPPIGLNGEEVKAVMSYLVSLDGEDEDMDYLMSHSIPKKILDAVASAADAVPFEPYFEGDAEYGEEIFWDPESIAPCAKCHSVGDKGGTVGPNLTTIAATQTPNYILESILDPSAVIVGGFETVLIVTNDGRYIDGIDKGEGDEGYSVLTGDGEIVTIPMAEIEEVAPQSTSMMPGNFRELMTMDDFHNILAYVLTLTGEEEGEGETAEGETSEEGSEEGGA